MKNQSLSIVYFTITLGWATSSQATDATCAPGDILSGNFDDVTVVGPCPESAGDCICHLQGALVSGDVMVQPDAEVWIGDGSAENETVVEGDVFIEGGNTTTEGGKAAVIGSDIQGDIYVGNSGEANVVLSSSVGGDIRVEHEGFIYVYFDSEVRGNVEGYGAEYVRIADGSTVGGSVKGYGASYVTVSQSTIGGRLEVYDALKSSGCTESRIDGKVKFVGNHQRVLITACDIGGTVKVARNTGGVSILDNTGPDGNIAGALELKENTDNTGEDIMLVGNNRIEGNLKCKANDPEPTDLQQPNEVGGKAKGQCKDLAF